MSSSRGQWIAVGIIVAVLSGALTAGVLLQEDVSRVTVGADAPDFEAIDLATGNAVSLAEYKGDVILLNLWATWCAPCRTEMPSMERLHEELGPLGLRIVAVSVDAVGPEDVMAFVNELGLTFDILHDQSQAIERRYQTSGLPETFVINREGEIVHWEIGPVEWDAPPQIARLRRILSSD